MRTLTATALTALATFLPQAGMPAQEISLPVGAEAPAAALEDLDGNPVQLLDLVGTGKPTVLEFWATWCSTCRRLQPEMDRVQSTFGDRVNVVGIAVAVSQTPAQVKAHMVQHGISYTILWDGKGEAVRNYDAPGTGLVLILDGDGVVVYNGTGPNQPLVGELGKLLGN